MKLELNHINYYFSANNVSTGALISLSIFFSSQVKYFNLIAKIDFRNLILFTEIGFQVINEYALVSIRLDM